MTNENERQNQGGQQGQSNPGNQKQGGQQGGEKQTTPQNDDSKK